jgi:cytochrome o ubiquinol oxidase operon protein cyoD
MVQLIFFLHIGEERGGRWKLLTFVFVLMTLGIIVVGSIWIMNNLNYNMSPAQVMKYIKDQRSY